MKAFWKWLGDWWFIIILVALFLLAITGYIFGSLEDDQRQDLCISAGYAGWERVKGLRTDVCYSTLLEDGTFVIVPIETVLIETALEELEAR